MTDTNHLVAIESMLSAATGERWIAGRDAQGLPAIRVRLENGDDYVLRVTREENQASSEDVDFIAHSRDDLGCLVACLRGEASLTEQELSEIEARANRASPVPWRPFLETEGGVGGYSVISVSDHDDEPDLYLWLGEELAPDADFELVAAARNDIPRLLSLVRGGGGPDSS